MLLYSFLSAVALLLYLPFIVLKKGPQDRIAFIKERLGISRYEKTDIWVHAVSVGEVIACIPFLKVLKKEFPGKKITLSTTTYTGQKVARERFPEAERIMYMPWDSGMSVLKPVHSLRPDIFITVETELWPVLFRTLKRQGSRIIILNGRISNKSYTGYKRLGFLMKHVLSYPDFLFMQGNNDAERIINIGADRSKVGVMGNFKFDITFDTASLRPECLEGIKGKILLAASTHKGEEEIILEAFASLSAQRPDLKLIIAPRHPERFAEVEEIIRKRNLSYIRRTAMNVAGANSSSPLQYPAIILLDTIGELSRTFSVVTIAFIGGSLVPVGGHNILEPAYWSKPILFGPYMDNFPFAADFLDQSAAIQVKDAKDIILTVKDLLDTSDKAVRMGQAAKGMVEKNTGAVEKAIGLIRGFIGTA
ncbi:MAG: 3-deoxy-D-manno-octulosonic acid transferase [Nitrospiraceae bacterium]|nr:MAG: 3-deoxy-D-manno-octulosonic acid transferase [Nitrospiraceae bacterium]